VKSKSVFDVHVLWHCLEDFSQFVDVHLAFALVLMELCCCVILCELFEGLGNALQGCADVCVLVSLKNLIVLIQMEGFLFLAPITDLMVGDIIQIVEEG
jgi:hypothetical protein